MNDLVREGESVARDDRFRLIYRIRIPSYRSYGGLGSLIDIIVCGCGAESDLNLTSRKAGWKQDLKSREDTVV